MNDQINVASAIIWPTALAGVIGSVLLAGAVLVGPVDAAAAHAELVFTQTSR